MALVSGADKVELKEVNAGCRRISQRLCNEQIFTQIMTVRGRGRVCAFETKAS